MIASVEAVGGGFVVSASGVSIGNKTVSEVEVVPTALPTDEEVAEVVTWGTSASEIKDWVSVGSLTDVPTMETEVWEETGDPGTVGVSSNSVAADDGTVESV